MKNNSNQNADNGIGAKSFGIPANIKLENPKKIAMYDSFDSISEGLSPMQDELSKGYIDLSKVYKILDS